MVADLEAAGLAYLSAGLKIIALSGKAPNGAIHRHGLKEPFFGDASREWAAACSHPDTTGVGIVIDEHFVVVDIDGEEGRLAFRKFVGDTELPMTPAAKTARGWHLWYVTTEAGKTIKLAEKLDLKGVGGYVAAPPSIHPSGFVYTWLVPLVTPEGEAALIDRLPQAIEEELHARRSQVFVSPWYERGGNIDSLAKYLAGQPVGNRNACLYWASATARDTGIAFADAAGALIPASALPLDEAMRTVKSAYRL
jgi:hypothetical protein